MKKRVLIIDDDPVIRILLSEYLATYGFSVEALAGGREALHLLQNSFTPSGLPHIILLDLQMPDLTGIDVLREIRSNSRTAAIRVIMLSANADAPFLGTEPNTRADYYLQKPFDMRMILHAIREMEGVALS